MIVNDRYSRQILLDKIKKNGQDKLKSGRIVVIGCGALGTTIANNLTRAGIGYLKIVDRDIIELNNLQRQNLFDEDDIGFPKASIAGRILRKINSDINIDYIVDDVNHGNIEDIIRGMDIVLDGTDNMLTRFLINDACVKNNVPWIYGGAIETYGITMNIIPNITPCFRCLIHDLPDTSSLPTCDTVGVLNTIPSIIGSIQSTEAIKYLSGNKTNMDILSFDVWTHAFNSVNIEKKIDCECCVKNNFEFLNAKKSETSITLCGRGAVQINPVKSMNISLKELGLKLEKIGQVEYHDILLRFKVPNYELNIFGNGRTIIIGTNDLKIAKSLYSKYIGV